MQEGYPPLFFIEGDEILTVFLKIYKITVAIVSFVAVILALLLVGVRIFGLTPYTVLSGSMEPEYHVGSVIYVKDADIEALEVENSITFVLDGITVTHRIIRIEESQEGLRFYTMGDANNTPDGGFVTPDEIIGTPVFSLPYLGYVFLLYSKPARTVYRAWTRFTACDPLIF